MPLVQLDTENADLNLTSSITVLTDTPDASNPTQCIGLVLLGDGAKNLDGTGGAFELVVTVGGQTVQPSPQLVTFGTEVRSAVWTSVFPVPANTEIVMKVKSPNGADTDVDVTAYLYDAQPIITSAGKVSGVALVDTCTANSDMRGTDGANTTVPDAAGVAAGLIGALNDFDPANDAVANVTLVATCTTNTDMRGTDSAYTGTPPTAGAIADAVWNEAYTDHVGADTTGEVLRDVRSYARGPVDVDGADYAYQTDAGVTIWTATVAAGGRTIA